MIPAIVILAAGQGKRMHSELPKVLHELSGVSMIEHVLETVYQSLPKAPIALVVGHGHAQVESKIKAFSIQPILQSEQLGTGHALQCVLRSDWGKNQIKAKRPIVVLPGDLPLISKDLVSKLAQPLPKHTALRLLSTTLLDPKGYGRVIRKGKKITAICEERDATLKQKQIKEVATSIYLFDSSFLEKELFKLKNRNSQKEYYLTDLVGIASKQKKQIEPLFWENSEELRGVNDLWELAEAELILQKKRIEFWAKQGVKFLNPKTTWIDHRVQLSKGVVIESHVSIKGKTTIQEGALIKQGCVIDESTVGAGASVGPYAHLRPQSHVGKKCKVGNFVELKKTTLGEATSVAHLSYLGDAQVGQGVNIGCGFVTCNYDGRVIQGERKHKTIIEDQVFIGSDCQVVAPIRIGKKAYIASGSTITEDVKPYSLAIARQRQINKPDYVKKLLKLDQPHTKE